MSDCDKAQMNAIEEIHPDARVLLCQWHVLHAIRKFISIPQYRETWELIKQLPKIQEVEEFDKVWDQIRNSSVLDGFLEYMIGQ